MEAIDDFSTDYFLLELQQAGVIKNDPHSLEKVPNITIGLVLAVISLKRFETHQIFNWIRKGRKVTALVEEQFALYDKLSIYLKNNVCIKEDIQEWKQILDGTKYVFPEKECRGWSQIFGETPNLLEEVDPENVSNSCIVQQPKKIIETEDEENKHKKETEKNPSKVFFSHDYFLSLLQEVGAIVNNDTENDIPIDLVKVPNITIELVLAAKAINLFTDEAILTWIRKGRKVTPLIEEQFILYKKLADYLMNHIDLKDIEKWKSLFNSRYIFPSSDNEKWSLVFGEIPELCCKIDEAQKSCEQLETSKIEIEAPKSYQQEETPVKEIEEAIESYKQIEISLKECEEVQKTNDPLRTQEMGKAVNKDITKSGKAKCLSDHSALNINEMAVNVAKENVGKNEVLAEMKQAASTGIDSDQIKHIDESIDDMAVNRIKKEVDENYGLTKIDQIKHIDKSIDDMALNRIKKDGGQNDGLTEIKEASFAGGESFKIECIDKTNEEIAGNKIEDDQNENEAFAEIKETQSESNGSSNGDDDWEDIFDAVGAELTAAEIKDEESLSESVITSKRDGDCLSDGDIYDLNNDLDYEFSIDSDTEILEDAEDGNEDLDDDENVLDLEVETNELLDTMETEFGATEAENAHTIINCTKDSESNVEQKTEKVPPGIRKGYFLSILKEAGILTKKQKQLRLHYNITVGILCSIKALDIFTNKQIFAWIKQSRNLSRNMSSQDHIKLASYRELANFLMNEVDKKDIKGWRIFLKNTSYLDYTCHTESDWQKTLQNHQWKLPFKYDQYVPEICHSFKIKFNSNYFLAQLLGYDAVRREINDGIVQHYLVDINKLEKPTVGLVLAAKAADLFPDKDIVDWISKCKNIASIDLEKIYEQLAIYKEFYNYLEKEADERDYEYVSFVLFSTLYVPWIKDTDKPNWDVCFNQNINLHKRFRDFSCCYDLSHKEKLASMEVVDPVHQEASEVCKVWNDLFAENSDQVSDKHSNDKPFHSNYFENLLLIKNVTDRCENENKSSLKLNEIEKVTVGLVMATINQQFKKQDIADWVKKSHGTKPTRRQFFMYEILCDHLINLKCNIEANYWKQLINSIEYQDPVENCDIWINIFGNQIPNLLGVALVGKFEFERLYRGISCYNRDEYKTEFLECIQLRHDLYIDSIKETQNFLFDKEYFASLLTSCGALSDSSSILKKVTDLTIGQVMAAICDTRLNEEDIYEWIIQSEKNICTEKTLETLDLKSQFLAYKLLASYLMNYPSQNLNDPYLNSWRKFLNNQYVFSNVGDFPLERFISPQINSIYLSSEWCIYEKYELKSIIPQIRESFQSKSFEKINEMVPNMKSIPMFHIVNENKIFGVGKAFFAKKLMKDRVVKRMSANSLSATLNEIKSLKVVHVLGVFSLGKFKETDIKNWITACLGFNGVVPFGPLKRIMHYLLCEVPKELVVEWGELLGTSFHYWSKDDGLGNIHSLFRHFKKYLCNDVDIFKHNNDYIPNECRKFISGNCTKDGCKQYHICCKRKYCKSFPKSQLDVNATKGESESLIATKDEPESDYWKWKILQKWQNKDENLDEHENEELDSIQPQHSAGSVHSRLGPQVKNEKEFKISGMCKKFNASGKCSSNQCSWPHFCDACGGDHSKMNCLNRRLDRKQRRAAVFGDDPDNDERESKRARFESEPFEILSNLPIKTGEDEKQFEISSMCKHYNHKECTNVKCKWPHRCKECGGDHPQFQCDNKQQKTEEKGVMCKWYNTLVKCPKKQCKWPHRCNDCGGNHPQFRCAEIQLRKDEEKGLDDKQFEIPGMCKWYNSKKCTNVKCKWPHRCNECGGDHPQFKCGNRQPEREEKVENPVKSRMSGMCNAYNNLGPCLHTPCLYPHRCDECGEEHPRRKCGRRGEDEKKIEIPGMCKYYNSKKCGNVHCKWPHRCNECGGDHPQFKCGNRQRGRQEKGIDRSQMSISRSRSPVHNKSKYLSVRDESPSWQHQLPSMPQKKALLATPSHLHGSQSAHQSDSPHGIQSAHQSDSPHGLQSAHQIKKLNTPTDTSSKFSVFGVSHILYNMSDHFDVEFKNLCKTTLSKVFEVKHNEDKMIEVYASHLNVLRGIIDELCEQLETVHDTQTKILLTKCVSDTKYLLKKAKSVSMNSLKTSLHSESKMNPPSVKDTLLAGVVEKVAKVTLNKDTACMIDHIKKEVEILGIPATMEIIGKLVVEISEHQKANALKGVLSDYYGHGSTSKPIYESPERTDYGQSNSDYYGHGSSSSQSNQPSVNTDYGRPSWNQGSGMSSQQNTGRIYRGSDDNDPDNTWCQSSGSMETSQPSQRLMSPGIRRGGRSNNHPDDTWYERSDSMENFTPSQRSRSRGIRRGGRSSGNHPDNTWYESSGNIENPQPSQRSRSRGIRRGGRSSGNHPENPGYENSGNMEIFKPSQRSRSRGIRRGGSFNDPSNEPSVSTDYGQPSWNQRSEMPSQQKTEHMYQGIDDNYPDDTWYESSRNVENPQPSKRSRSRGIRRGGGSNNPPDDTWYQSSGNNPQPSQRSRSRGMRRGSGSHNHQDNTWFQSSGNRGNPQSSQRSRSRGIRRGGRW